MPTISINKAYFHKLLGKQLTFQEFEDIAFDYGLEAEEDKDNASNVKVELPANRYDLLCVEGLALSLTQYLGLKPRVEFKCQSPQHSLIVHKEVKGVRPIGVSGIIRNVSFTQEAYDSFIDFQDKLHHNLGRKRTLVSIGTHDFDKTTPPYTYTARRPSDFAFVPLNQSKSMSGRELIEFYKEDTHLKPYVGIIEHAELIPLIEDCAGNILSMPPVINSELSKISLGTKNIFIDITATDQTKALIALDVLLACFSSYSATPFTFEQVLVVDPDIGEYLTPKTPLYKTMTVKQPYLERIIGLSLDKETIVGGLTKMGLAAEHVNGDTFSVSIPFYRSDVLHQCDIAEDLAICIGYNKVPYIEPDVICLGKQNELNKESELMRQELAFAGFTECLNFSLCAKDDLGKRLLRGDDERAVVISNPKTQDFQVGRTTLLPGLLKSLQSNKMNKLPFQLFELGDVMLLGDSNRDEENVGAVNRRKLAAVHCNSSTSGLDLIHGLLDLVMVKLYNGKQEYELRETSKSYFLHSLQCAVYIQGKEVGEMGIINPEVMKITGISVPTAFIELDFEDMVEIRKQG